MYRDASLGVLKSEHALEGAEVSLLFDRSQARSAEQSGKPGGGDGNGRPLFAIKVALLSPPQKVTAWASEDAAAGREWLQAFHRAAKVDGLAPASPRKQVLNRSSDPQIGFARSFCFFHSIHCF